MARVLVHISKTSDIRVSLMQMEPPEAMEALEQGLADCAIIFQYNSLPLWPDRTIWKSLLSVSIR